MDLYDKLVDYSQSDVYPFHMPGHKRQVGNPFLQEFPNPYAIDITEIDGFDNLHHAEGIIRESMDRAAKMYGADRSYYLVNGSSCGILSAVCGMTQHGGKILMSRNCHKAAYHGVFLNPAARGIYLSTNHRGIWDTRWIRFRKMSRMC